MNKKNLLKEMSWLGLPLIESEQHLNVNKILYEVVKNKEMRLWEGFPILLANANKKGGFNFKTLYSMFKNKDDKINFINLMLLSFSVYGHFNLSFWWMNKIYADLPAGEKDKIHMLSTYLKDEQDFTLSDYKFSSARIKNVFQSYFKEKTVETKKTKEKYETLSLEYALSQIFSAKQKNLFLKRLGGEKMTKTEKEYYSRAVKKKVVALSNLKLHQMAQRLLEY